MRALIFASVVLAALCFSVEGCCLPKKFSTDFTIAMNMSVVQPGQRVSINALFRKGSFYVDTNTFDVSLSTQGDMLVSVNDMTIPAKASLQVGMDNGDSVWMNADLIIPGMGRKGKCYYIDIIGDIPNGYTCYLNKLKKLENDAEGHRRFEMNVPNTLSDIITVSDQCVPLKEKASVTAQGVNMRMAAFYTNEKVLEAAERKQMVRPFNCELKDTVRLPPPSQGVPEEAIEEEIDELANSSRRKRALDATKDTIYRVARSAAEDMLAHFLP